MITLKHRTAFGRLDACWEFDSARGVVDLVLRLGSAEPLGLTVRVCATDKPKLWCHPIMRLDADSWRILPAIWIPSPESKVGCPPKLAPRECVERGSRLRDAIPCELHSAVGGGVHLVLTNAPAAVDFDLEGLSA